MTFDIRPLARSSGKLRGGRLGAARKDFLPEPRKDRSVEHTFCLEAKLQRLAQSLLT
jgi:hypothetical protein